MAPLSRVPGGRLFVAVVLSVTAVIAAAATTRHHFTMQEESRPPAYLTWGHAILQEVPYFALWALAAPLVYWFVRRVARGTLPLPAAICGHAAFALAVIALHSVVHHVLPKAVAGGLDLWSGDTLSHLLWQLPAQLGAYAAVLSAVFAYDYYRRYLDRELAAAALATELAEARLDALRAQLHPHFVFNALNSVSMLVRGQRNTEAVDAIAGLSDLLRGVLAGDGQPEVTLEEELALVRRYLAIEQLRFGDRLRVDIDVATDAAGARVPRLLLQPIVENAIRHGVSRRAAAGRVAIRARRDAQRLTIMVTDDGPGPRAVDGPGLGLANARQRLETLYGSAASIALAEAPGGGAVATVTLPYASATREPA